MSAASLVTCLARPTAQQHVRGASQPQRMAVQCEALSFHAQPHTLTASSTSYSAGMGQQYSEGPSCAWPQASVTAESQSASAHSGVWAMLSGFMDGFSQPAGTSALPPEVERLMLFTDAPEASEPAEQQGWMSLWRYQGFK